ncbi:MAG TPA: hypothetical protein VGO78_05030 [Acidimicrobiales bacterium]|nr:hypothetical protein [Acidimicrobiales bacterium]
MSLDDRLRRGLAGAAGLAPMDPDGDQRAALALGRRRQRRQRVVLASALVVVVAGVALGVWQLAGGDSGPDGTTLAGPGPTTTATTAEDGASDVTDPTVPQDPSTPPHVVVRSSEHSLDLAPFTYCYGSVCADGAPVSPLPDIGTADELEVAFPLPDWSFTATFTEVVPDGQCPREQQVPLEANGDGTFVLRPAGYAGTYDVTLFGRGEGDVSVAFRWTTPTDGPLAEPTARLAVLADHDGQLDSYGVELEVANLDHTPAAPEALITVRAADGETLGLSAPGDPDTTCRAGYLYWSGGPQETGMDAVVGKLAGHGSPYTYRVDLVLDGVHHIATARWPGDQIPGNEPSVALDFEPPLPALAPR